MPFQILMVFVCVLGADVPDRDQLEEIAARMATRHEDLYDSAASNALFTFANAWVRIPTIPPCCSEGRRPVVPKDSGRVFRVIAATCSE